MHTKLKVILLGLILIFSQNIVFAEDIPIIVIAPSKKAQSVSTVGTTVTVLDEALYNANNSQDFELHQSEETELVIKILELAGIEIKDPQVYQVAAAEEAQNIQQENK